MVIQEEGDDTPVGLSAEVPLPNVIIPKSKENNPHEDQQTQASRTPHFTEMFS